MDYFHRAAFARRYVGPGGAKCSCCNGFFGPGSRGRKRLRRSLRRALRRDDRNLLTAARNHALD